jgi:hypothetical protein
MASRPIGWLGWPMAEFGPTTDGAGPTTVFRAFEVSEFREWPTWDRLLRILQSNGGSYGLSGARGAGKSWLMLRAIEWVRGAPDTGRLGGIGLWYPSPSEYDPLAFLASLSDSFGTEIDRWYRRHPRVQQMQRIERWMSVIAAIALGAAAFGAATSWGNLSGVVIGVGGAVLAFALILALLARFRPYRAEARLAAEAALVRERARYVVTRSETMEFGAEGGRGFVARARRARERQLVERPATLSSLVNDFRALAEEAGRVAGRVVIAIDELDKMVEPDKVRALLRDIKGIFEVPRVHFLVSVSDEAARSLSVGALFSRNEFNSSFYTVLDVKPGRPDELAELLEQRSESGVPRDIALVLAVLAGGNPREVLRLAELADSATTGAEAAADTLEDEALSLRREVVTAAAERGVPALGPEARVGAFNCLPDSAFADIAELSALTGSAFDGENWEPSWADRGFEVRFREPWQRLMVRLAVAGQLVESPSLVRDRKLASRLRDVVVAASQSADVARTLLERELRIEKEGPDLEVDQARSRLAALADRYEKTRKTQPGGRERTIAMDGIAGEARSAARDAGLSAPELAETVREGGDGQRVIALAAIQATGDPVTFDAVLDTVVEPRTPFEGYHALLALETLLPSLDAPQLDVARAALNDEFLAGVADDPPRARLAERLVERLRRRDPAMA